MQHITKYRTDGKRFATAWTQINILGKRFCLFARTIEL